MSAERRNPASGGGAANPLLELKRCGQSIWLDYIRRSLISSGELDRLVREDGLAGMTSNPTIFEQAIDGSADYDGELVELAAEGATAEQILWRLIVEDIRAAADALRPVYDATEGGDGFVSVELPPELAHDAAGSVREGRSLWAEIDRPNLMVKVPGTPEGAVAVERLTAAGVNVNVTLLFSLSQYERVARAYQAGGAGTASVASFFLSRIDSAVDPSLPEALRGRTAIASARLAYRRFGQLFGPSGRRRTGSEGRRAAGRQRLLWASTSTKNPAYSDVLYVESLIGSETVNTLPPATLAAFRDHGHAARTLDAGGAVAEAERWIGALPQHGVDLDAVCQRLQDDGVAAFQQSWDKLKTAIEAKRVKIAGQARGGAARRANGSRKPARGGGTAGPGPDSASLGAAAGAIADVLAELRAEDVPRRLRAADLSLWGGRGAGALGWLDVPEAMKRQLPEIGRFASEVRDAGLRHVFLLGMGGSSLCPDVLRRTFGTVGGHPSLTVLDTSDPATILRAARSVDLNKVLFLVASKSGTTLEPDCLYRFFWDKLPSGDHFAAVTDPGTSLDREAIERHFRRAFLNPADIGGRYSALSYFGLVPAALAGLDTARLLDRALGMSRACGAGVPPEQNPGVWLGAVMGGAWKAGRDKVTFVAPPALAAFPDWLEQLLAESTGKQGKGLVPVAGEPLGTPDAYGDDRLFIAFHLAGDPAGGPDLSAIEAAGHPVVHLHLTDLYDIGAEFYRWEVATAVAGHVLGIDAFDQPNVQEAKDRTSELLEAGVPPIELIDPAQPDDLPRFLADAGPGDYVAFMAYLPYARETERLMTELRRRVRDRLRVATTFGYGPRFLHSTGQLHKGGSDRGLFVQITATDAEDAAIPGRSFSFGTVKRAQALGDYRALRSRHRRVIHLHLGPNGLEEALARWR